MSLPDPLFLANDVEEVLRHGDHLTENSIGRCMWLMVEQRFRTWLQRSATSGSDLILVDGHLDDVTTGKISPLSVFGASFAKVRKAPRLVVLHHFCGLHSHPKDPVSGPRGILRSFIAQILLHLSHYGGDFMLLPHADGPFLRDLSEHQPQALLVLFKELLSQIHPEATVYCLVDNVSDFETASEDWEMELCEIVDTLQIFVKAGEPGPALKILLTDSRRSIAVFRHIRPGDQISLSSGNTYSRTMQMLSFQEDLQEAEGY